MTDSADARSISLNDIGLRYFQGIQRMSDLMVFAWAGARTVSEQGYEEMFKGVPGLPSTEFRADFDTAREEGERWWLRHSVNEVLGLVVHFLEEIRKLSGLVVFNAARSRGDSNLASLAAELNAVTGSQDIATRFKQLRERYGVATPLENEIVSLTQLAQTLFQRNGVVAEGETVTLRVKMIQPPVEGSTEARMGDFEKSWKGGDKISLTRPEHAAIFTTASLLIGSLLTAVQEFAQKSGLPEAPAAAQ